MFSKCFHLLLAIHLLSSPVVPAHPEPSERIIGGSDMEITAVPWQVALLEYGKQICGGSIYSETIIITAAHCVENNTYTIRAGSSLHDSGGVLMSVKSIVIHPQYYKRYLQNDVAILKLSSPLRFSDSIRAIPLAKTEPATGSLALATGWGRNIFFLTPRQLQGVEILIQSRTACNINENDVFNGVICSGQILKGGCMGDSGGPLVVDGQLVGIASSIKTYLCFGHTVYTSVAYYRNWILNTIKSI